jgi:hypothetical protein
VGLRIVGDSLYGGQPLLLSRLKPDYRQKRDLPERPLIDRVALHAAQLSFTHPITGQPVTITSPSPKDLTVAVKYLRRFAPGGASSLLSEQSDQADGDVKGDEQQTGA